MKIRSFFVAASLSALTIIGLSGYIGGVDNNRTGAQIGDQGCGFCHSSNDAHLIMAFELDSAGVSVLDYRPGMTYTIKMIAANTSATYLPKFGFQLSSVKAVEAFPTQAGTFTPSAIPGGTRLRTVGAVTYLQQSSKLSPSSGYGDYGTVYTISTEWVAPSNLLDSAIFCGVVCAVNNNDSADAIDIWNMKSRVFKKHVDVNAIRNLDISDDIQLFPNPAVSTFNLKLGRQIGTPLTISIFDVAGKMVYFDQVDGSQSTITVNGGQWPAGLYHGTITGKGFAGNFRLNKY